MRTPKNHQIIWKIFLTTIHLIESFVFNSEFNENDINLWIV
jgi:hypothetical protein